jgi:hypothetical protein
MKFVGKPALRARGRVQRAALPAVVGLAAWCIGIGWAGGEPPASSDPPKGWDKHTLPDQRRVWRFDQDAPGDMPKGFVAASVGANSSAKWVVEQDPQAASVPNRLTQSSACRAADASARCWHLLLVDGGVYEYPDLLVRLRAGGSEGRRQAGVVFGLRDERNFYAVLVDLGADTIEAVRVANGRAMVLGQEAVKRGQGEWHLLRVQHNTILSKDFLEISFDGRIVFTHWDQRMGAGQIGLATSADGPISFDNFDAVQLVSQRPLSPPAAY